MVLASCIFLPIPQQIKPYQYLFRERKRAKRHLKGRMASSNPNLEVGLRTRRDDGKNEEIHMRLDVVDFHGGAGCK